MEFPVPDEIKEFVNNPTVEKRTRYQICKIGKLIRQVDREHAQATRELSDFVMDPNHPHHTLVRKYEHPNTAFETSDPIAPGSIVVDRWINVFFDENGTKTEEPNCSTNFWISPRRDSKGRPVIYRLIDLRAERFPELTVSERKGRITALDPNRSSDRLLMERFSATPDTDKNGVVIIRHVIEVWVKGKPETRKNPAPITKKPIELKLNPQTIPI